MKICYDTPIEVTESQYNMLVQNFLSVISHRESAGKFYIKVWHMGYAKLIKQILTSGK